MRISERLRSRAPFFSFEFFPPKTDAGVASLMDALATLRALDPAYVSVTYGAGGSTRDRTIEIAKRIEHEVGLDVLAHVTCSGSTADDLRALLRDARARVRLLHRGRVLSRKASGGDQPAR
jgi:methylenetetrahydrofolate reductase (NADPH)